MYQVLGKWEMHTKCGSENMMGRDHLEDLGKDGRIILKEIPRKQDRIAQTGFI
jgi:hypothetical protein